MARRKGLGDGPCAGAAVSSNGPPNRAGLRGEMYFRFLEEFIGGLRGVACLCKHNPCAYLPKPGHGVLPNRARAEHSTAPPYAV